MATPVSGRVNNGRPPAMIEIASLVRRFGAITALDGISLSIAEGEFFGLLGPNGAGKSTLMSLLCGYLDPDEGEIRIAGDRLRPDSLETRSRLGLVPQSVALYTDLTAEQNLRIFGTLYGMRGRDLKARVEEVLVAVQLQERRRHKLKTFSGGMQRRLNIAAGLIYRPRVLLCDEPTVGVDPQSRNAIFELLLELNRAGMTVIYSTHYMEEAQKLCSRIGIIEHGKILALGTVDELLARLPFEEEVSCRREAEASVRAALAAHGEVTEIDDRLVLRPPPGFLLSDFFRHLETNEIPIRAIQLRRPTLEAVFLHLTGRSLRE